MARTNATRTRITPEVSELLVLTVLRTARISPSFVRVTLGGPEAGRFRPLGRDQWFRLFIPVASGGLDRLPDKLDTLAYLRFLAISKDRRPVLRSYTVSAARPDAPGGPEIDVDLVVHGDPTAGTAGPAVAWALAAQPGDTVGFLDEGVMFNPPADTAEILLVGDETALPAIASICASWPTGHRGRVLVELPMALDRLGLVAPDGIALEIVVRPDGTAPGEVLVPRLAAAPAPSPGAYGWAAGEQSLVAAVRRAWIGAGLDKHRIMFCGYWKAPRRTPHPAP